MGNLENKIEIGSDYKLTFLEKLPVYVTLATMGIVMAVNLYPNYKPLFDYFFD